MIRFRLFYIIAFLFVILSSFTIDFIPIVKAMGKRPNARTDTKVESFELPEIEIITKPGANKKLLSKDKQEPAQVVPVKPKEVLPAVGSDISVVSRKYRIKDIQKALKNAGFPVSAIDGKMGPKTKKAIKNFQKANELTADGVVGVKTWEKLKPYINSGKDEKTKN